MPQSGYSDSCQAEYTFPRGSLSHGKKLATSKAQLASAGVIFCALATDRRRTGTYRIIIMIALPSIYISPGRLFLHGLDMNGLTVAQLVLSDQYNVVAPRQSSIDKEFVSNLTCYVHMLDIRMLIAYNKSNRFFIGTQYTGARNHKGMARGLNADKGAHTRQERFAGILNAHPHLKCIGLRVCLRYNSTDGTLKIEIRKRGRRRNRLHASMHLRKIGQRYFHMNNHSGLIHNGK